MAIQHIAQGMAGSIAWLVAWQIGSKQSTDHVTHLPHHTLVIGTKQPQQCRHDACFNHVVQNGSIAAHVGQRTSSVLLNALSRSL